jgi:hypothetical protein
MFDNGLSTSKIRNAAVLWVLTTKIKILLIGVASYGYGSILRNIV